MLVTLTTRCITYTQAYLLAHYNMTFRLGHVHRLGLLAVLHNAGHFQGNFRLTQSSATRNSSKSVQGIEGKDTEEREESFNALISFLKKISKGIRSISKLTNNFSLLNANRNADSADCG